MAKKIEEKAKETTDGEESKQILNELQNIETTTYGIWDKAGPNNTEDIEDLRKNTIDILRAYYESNFLEELWLKKKFDPTTDLTDHTKSE